MARLFGIIGNRPDLAARVLAFEADAPRAVEGALPGWGIGYQGEVLMRRGPSTNAPSSMWPSSPDVRLTSPRPCSVRDRWRLRTENPTPSDTAVALRADGDGVGFERVRDRLVASVPDCCVTAHQESRTPMSSFMFFFHFATMAVSLATSRRTERSCATPCDRALPSSTA